MPNQPPSDLSRRAFVAAGLCACCAGTAWPSFAATSAASTGGLGPVGLPTALELGRDPMTRIGPDVWVARLAPGLWLHTTTAPIAGGAIFPANGLVLERPGGSLLIDTGNTSDQAERLLKWSRKALSGEITLAVATHFHTDRTGGIDGLARHGVRTVAHPLTCRLAREHGLPTPEPIDDFSGPAYALGKDCELFFPGAGHTRDNIVAWTPRQKVLFGGCFLKSVTSNSLGNVADAVIPDWTGSLGRLSERYPTPRAVVPGHGVVADDPIAWTRALLAQVSKAT